MHNLSYFLNRVRKYLIQPTILFGAAMIAMLWFGISLQIRSEFDAARHGAEQDLGNFARVFEEHVVRTVRELDKALLIAIKRYQHARTDQSYEEAIGQRLPDPTLLSDMSFQMAMIDRDGFLTATTIGEHPPKRIDLNDRAHFKIHKTVRPDTPFISVPVLGRRSGRWSVQLTRRVPGENNSFDGVIVASMNPDHFANFYGSINVGQDGVVVLAGEDGIVRATAGSDKLKLGSNISATDLVNREHKPGVLNTGDLDGSGDARIYAKREIPGHPLFVSVGVSPQHVFGQAASNRNRYLLVGSIVTFIVLIAMLISVLHQRSLERARIALTESEGRAKQKSEELELTLDNMEQGIIMVDGDRKIAVVNERFEELLELPGDRDWHSMSFDALVDFLEERGEFRSTDQQEQEELDKKLRASSERSLTEYFERIRPNGNVLAIQNQKLPGGGFVRTITDITEQRQSEWQIAHLAKHDTLTDLANRTLFREHLQAAISGIADGGGFGVLFLDLDHFKVANDTYGHSFGDNLLRGVGERLEGAVRQTDVVARLGGDEFAIILDGIEDLGKISMRAGQLIELMRAPFLIEDQQISITISIGCAVAPHDATTPGELLKHADLALYKAKADGRDTFRLFAPEMAEEMSNRRQLEEDLTHAIARGELELHYQPLNKIENGSICGFEALLRWNHKERGRIAPMDFIPIAEDSGLILSIGEWVLEEACREAATWDSSIRIAVNLSPVQFRDAHLVDKVRRALRSSGIKPERLELEITETVMMQTGEATIQKLHDLHQLGVKISMDDFGTGYSSLSYLKNFSFDKIKIDRSFVNQLTADEESQAIVKAIISLAECLGVRTTAEGVETKEQLGILTRMGCWEAQGFLFSPPRPACELSRLFNKDAFENVAELSTKLKKKSAAA